MVFLGLKYIILFLITSIQNRFMFRFPITLKKFNKLVDSKINSFFWYIILWMYMCAHSYNHYQSQVTEHNFNIPQSSLVFFFSFFQLYPPPFLISGNCCSLFHCSLSYNLVFSKNFLLIKPYSILPLKHVPYIQHNAFKIH